MNPFLLLVVAGLGWLLSLLSATAARSLHALAVHELEELCTRRQRMDWFRFIVEHRERLTLGAESMRSIATVLTLVSLVAAVTPYVGDRGLTASIWLGLSAGGALLILAANSWIPHAVSRHAGVLFLYGSWRGWWLVSILAWPMILLSEMVAGILGRAAGLAGSREDEEEQLEDEIRSIVSEGERDGLLESEERDMIESVLELDEKDVCSVMTPRSRLDAIEMDTGWDEAVRFVVACGRTRVPVYHERIDDVRGILIAKDLLRESLLPADRRRPLRRLLRRVLSVPESTLLDEMLQQFLKQRTHLAIIRDEYGGVAGIVTIEDILEEIVGEIVDETDDEKPVELTLLAPGRLRVDGIVRIDVLNDRLGTGLSEEDDFDTVSGLIMSRLGRVPAPGTSLRVDNVQLTVLQASARAILKVEVEVDEEAPDETEASVSNGTARD